MSLSGPGEVFDYTESDTQLSGFARINASVEDVSNRLTEQHIATDMLRSWTIVSLFTPQRHFISIPSTRSAFILPVDCDNYSMGTMQR